MPKQSLLDTMARALGNTRPGYLRPPPKGELLFHRRYWDLADARTGQLAENFQGSPMAWQNAPYLMDHPGGNGPCLAISTLDEPNTALKRGGTGMDLIRHAVTGIKHVRWGLALGIHPHWGPNNYRVIDLFFDSAKGDGARPEMKFRWEKFNNTLNAVTNRWQVYIDNGAGAGAGTYVNIPGAAESSGLINGGLTGYNEGKAGYNIIEIDYDFEERRYLSLRVNDVVFGRRLPATAPQADRDALWDLGVATTGPLPIFARGQNFCTAIQNRGDAALNDATLGVYKSRTTLYKGEEYVSVLSYDSNREAWSE